MDELQRAAGHRCYALKDDFWHIRMHETDREKTAFVTPFGLYEWLVMHFGLCNAPTTFQALMEEVLAPFRDWVSGLLDDVCVWADTLQQLHERLLQLFVGFDRYGLFARQSARPRCPMSLPRPRLPSRRGRSASGLKPRGRSAICPKPAQQPSTPAHWGGRRLPLPKRPMNCWD